MASTAEGRAGSFGAYDAHQERSAEAQRRADKWMIPGTIIMGTAVLGIIGLPMFLRGLMLQIRAAKEGL